MKKFKILMALVTVLLSAAGVAFVALSIWANKPRGIRIDLDTLKS